MNMMVLTFLKILQKIVLNQIPLIKNLVLEVLVCLIVIRLIDLE